MSLETGQNGDRTDKICKSGTDSRSLGQQDAYVNTFIIDKIICAFRATVRGRLTLDS